jgi:hypothetical protein
VVSEVLVVVVVIVAKLKVYYLFDPILDFGDEHEVE